MAFMEWGDEYLTGIPEVDAQHKRLFQLVNQLHQSVVNGDFSEVAGKIINELVDYAIEHFATEERLFLARGYPQYEEHKREHDLLIRQTLEIQEQFRQRKITITYEMLDFLSDWLKKHTTDADLQFARFISAKE